MWVVGGSAGARVCDKAALLGSGIGSGILFPARTPSKGDWLLPCNDPNGEVEKVFSARGCNKTAFLKRESANTEFINFYIQKYEMSMQLDEN